MTWSADFNAAPRDRQIIVMTKAAKGPAILFFTTNWLEPDKSTRHRTVGRWNGFPENPKSLIAWTEIPEYQESGVTNPEPMDVIPRNGGGGEGHNTGGNHVTGGAERAPLITHRHIFLESMRQGE
jgi:hypothetical protein